MLEPIVTRSASSAVLLKQCCRACRSEMMLKAERMGLAMCSIDVQFHQRQGGGSSISWRDCLDYVRNLCIVVFSLGVVCGVLLGAVVWR